jgi:NADPH-dependent curcumin reductase CurA
MVAALISRQMHLVARPAGPPLPEHFRLVEVELPALADGEVLVENLWMSVDPYMRRSMDAEAKDLPPWPIGGALNGPSVGRVAASRNAGFRAGNVVESMSGWQSHFISNGDAFVPYLSADTAIVRRPCGDGVAADDWLGLFGIASQTGYFAMRCAASMRAGGTAVISSGAGTVGSIACQVAKIHGMRVVTSAGSADKRRWLLDEIGVDAALDYRASDFASALRAACPDGIDLLLENASPEHLSACLPLMNDQAMVLIAGFISLYSGAGGARVDNFEHVLDRYLTIRAFAFMDYLDQYDRFVAEMTAWRREGRMQMRQQMFEGLERAPDALAALFDGSAAGKLLVRIAD